MKVTLKEIVEKELDQFLLRDDIAPESIKIEVRYAGTTARLSIDQETLEEMGVQISYRNRRSRPTSF